jgi:hypothetical protein
MTKFKIAIMIFILLIVSNSFSQIRKKPAVVEKKEPVKTETITADKDPDGSAAIDPNMQQASAVDFMVGGVFGAVTIDGKNYQQMGIRPELKLWKLGVGLDINILLDEEGKVREEDWDESKDYIDKVYYISWGKKGEPFYFKAGGLSSTTLGYGTIISGYTNMLEYPTYKRQGLELAVDAKYAGAEFIVNNFKELSGKNPAVMGGGRIYIKPFSRLQIGGSFAGDLNEYKGLRDTDDDGYPDEIDMYPEDEDYVTEIDYYTDKLIRAGVSGGDIVTTINSLVGSGLISGLEKGDLRNYSDERSRTGFWAVDAGLKVFDTDFFDLDIYSQFSKCLNTDGWGFTAPGARITAGSIFEIYADYRQQSDEFIFGYYNDTYDLERAKYVDDGTGSLYVVTKKDRLKTALAARGYLAGLKINFWNFITGKAEYQDMKWGKEGDIKDKSLKGELALNQTIFPLISKAKAYYVQNNVEKIQWKTESTVMGGVIGLGAAPGVSIDFNYLITFEDKNGDGKIKGKEEEIRNVSISTTSMF